MPALLFDNTPVVDRDALAVLAERAIPRDELRASGWRNLLKSSDLFRCGYSVGHWIKPDEPGVEVLEYVPTRPAASGLPRLTASSYAEQVAVHEAIGVRVVPPGQRFLA